MDIKNNKCEWKLESDDEYIYSTSCADMYRFAEGNITENRFKNCPYCGGEIVEIEAD